MVFNPVNSANPDTSPHIDNASDNAPKNQNPVFDANHDGVITIADVTALIDQGLEQEMANHAPSQKMDVDAIIDEILTSDKPKANIGDVNKAIEHNLKQE